MRPQAGEIYRHFKGNEYEIVCIANDCEDDRELVIYKALYGEGKIYARELSEFMSPTDKRKYPNAEQELRFEKIAGVTGVTANDASRYVIEFLDSETIEDKLNYVNKYKSNLTEAEIVIMASSMDFEIKPNDALTMAEEFIGCLELRCRFESDRLRQ